MLLPELNKALPVEAGPLTSVVGRLIRIHTAWLVRALLMDSLPLAIGPVGGPPDEQHSKDELIELGHVHLTAQNVRGLQQEAFELCESDSVSAQPVASLLGPRV